MNNLKEYNKKRDFNKTKEPKGKKENSNKRKLKYVIQHHLARKDHYDLRLEWNGVYISFAIPKGPSFNPKDKRLAVHVEDHPISYGNFEGVIPKGEYGAGIVMLWDKGYWYPLNEPDFNSSVKFELDGERLKGKWSLIKFKDDNYLLIKENDKYIKSSNGISKYTKSIKTDRTFDEIKKGLDNIEITNPDKIIFPKSKITKKEIVDYYKKVSKRMFKFLDNRLISIVRAPSGIDGEMFFMKHLNTESKNLVKKKIKNEDYYYIKNESGIIDEVQMNSYEFHIWGSLQNNLNKPDLLVFDFDPDKKLSLKKIRSSVKDLKDILDKLKLKSYLKTSGGKGYHVFVPLITSSWKETEDIAKRISQIMINNNPNKYTTNMRMNKRKGKIFIDYFRNKKGSTSVCPYSIRLKEPGTVSCPISWSELDKIKPKDITIKTIDKRLKKKDPWNNFFD